MERQRRPVVSREQARALIPNIENSAIAKALFQAGRPLSLFELTHAANSLLENFGDYRGNPLVDSNVRDRVFALAAVGIAHVEYGQSTLTPTGTYMAEVLSRTTQRRTATIS